MVKKKVSAVSEVKTIKVYNHQFLNITLCLTTFEIQHKLKFSVNRFNTCSPMLCPCELRESVRGEASREEEEG